jgi:predicted TIM-barrel fold metal-dependent hydrolase
VTSRPTWGVSRGTAAPDLVEEVLDPDLPIVDAHHHLWDADEAMMREEYLLEDLAADLASGHNIEATVFVEAEARHRNDGAPELAAVGETEFVHATALDAERRGIPTKVAAAIVAHANLDLGADVERVLDAHDEAAPGRLRGIRDMTVFDRMAPESDPHRMLQPVFQEGLRRLAARDLTFDVYVWQVQLPDVIQMVRAVPEATFILNHLGGIVGIHPWKGQRDALFPQWKQDITTLAGEPNVRLKLGGMNMFIPAFDWHKGERRPSSQGLADATAKYFDHGIASFGPHRCMFESNFSPDKLSGSYRTLWNSFKRLAEGYTDSERADMFAGTARRTYRI